MILLKWIKKEIKIKKYQKIKDTVRFDIKDLSVQTTVKIKSRKVDDKILPDAEVIKLNYVYDFDFKLNSALGKLISLFKSPIKNAISKEINKTIDKEINHGLQIGLKKIPMEPFSYPTNE